MVPDVGSWNYAFTGVKWSAGMKYGLKVRARTASPRARPTTFSSGLAPRSAPHLPTRSRVPTHAPRRLPLVRLQLSNPKPFFDEAHRALHFLEFAHLEDTAIEADVEDAFS